MWFMCLFNPKQQAKVAKKNIDCKAAESVIHKNCKFIKTSCILTAMIRRFAELSLKRHQDKGDFHKKPTCEEKHEPALS